MLEFGMNPQRALDAPRVFVQYDQAGFALIPLAICSIVANVLLIFPDGEEDFSKNDYLSKYMSSFMGIGGGGITTFIAAFAFLSMAKCADSCGNENYAMYGSMLAALVGLTGSGYSFVISAMPMLELHCLINSNWAKYLFARESWSNCEQPAHNAEWNVTLLSIELVLSLIEFLICSVQFISGLVRTIRKPCSILSV
ncbi:hypothetical protein PGIGA_G00027840 [Pangasianodon gigas]|uniref:Uncharacterized protein n=1 Tax=Pangasianodon gigas TaxID=30993 RepID=A0ACC5WXD6_PANGG|nr:hypothetical protein [Pangasianodon gigas]